MNIFAYSGKDLSLNLSDIAAEAVREIDLAGRKVSIYSGEHPLAVKAVESLAFCLQKLFKVKRYLDLHLHGGKVYAMNIMVRPTIFSEHIAEYMLHNDIKSLLIETVLTPRDLAVLLKGLTTRQTSLNAENALAAHLDRAGIKGVLVNSELGRKIFDDLPHFGFELAGGYTARQILGRFLGDNVANLARIYSLEKDEGALFLEKLGLDYRHGLVEYFIPEVFSAIKVAKIIDDVGRLSDNFREKATAGLADIEMRRSLENIYRLVSLHPDLSGLVKELKSLIDSNNISGAQDFPEYSALSEGLRQECDAGADSTQNTDDISEFSDLMERLIRTGRTDKAAESLAELMDALTNPELAARNKSLIKLQQALEICRRLGNEVLLEFLVRKSDEYLTRRQETFEFSELLIGVARICLADRRRRVMDLLCDILAKRRVKTGDVIAYDSLAVKKTLDDMNRPEIINGLICDLVTGPAECYASVRKILTTIGSEEAASALSRYISHESRQVRMQVLRVMSEMGKSSLRVCAAILKENANFERPFERRELPDDRWYIVRNAIFVLGTLKDEEACRILGVRLSDYDTRVRRAIISALEQIGGQKAADLLIVMAEDPDKEIRESAIIALGIIKEAQIIPELIDLADKQNTEIVHIITVLGRLGGESARTFLSRLLSDNELLAKYASGKSSRDEIRLAAVKALGQIGDSLALESIRSFKNNALQGGKTLFTTTKLHRVVDEILSQGRN